MQPSLPTLAAAGLATLLWCLGVGESVASTDSPTPDPKQMIAPPALKRGDTIMFVAPAGHIDRAAMRRARKALEAKRYRVVERKDLYQRWGYMAGTDARRSRELMQAFTEDRIDAIFCAGGGYGAMRLLDSLDYDKIRANPKILLGFSDITALHLAIQQRAGVITFHGPVAESSLGSRNGIAAFTETSMFDTLEQRAYTEKGKRPTVGYLLELPKRTELGSYGRGKVRGRLTGGNLSLVASLMGTPYEIDTENAVLFLEDVRESAYRVDRMLTQLALGGKFDNLRGVILGQFTRADSREAPRAADDDFSVQGVLRRRFEALQIPVLTNFPAGHVRNNATLPFGATVEVDANKKRLRVLENPVRVH